MGFQQQLEQNGILGAADFLNMARNQIPKNIKKYRLVADISPKRQTFMDVYLKRLYGYC